MNLQQHFEKAIVTRFLDEEDKITSIQEFCTQDEYDENEFEVYVYYVRGSDSVPSAFTYKGNMIDLIAELSSV